MTDSLPHSHFLPGLIGAVTARWVLFTTLLIAAACPAAAQASGTISGVVLDSTGRYLEAAEISLDGSSARTTAARGGEFRLTGVPAGTHTVTVTYPGMAPFSETVRVEPGGSAVLRAQLRSDTVMMQAFTVATDKDGMSQAIALQKASFNQMLVAASDQFGDISEGNVGEYLKFLPGIGIDYNANDARAVSLRGMNPIFTTVTVDGGDVASGTSSGDSRRFELEQVAINNVETIEVFKTMTPDMAADNTGGQVNLVTKSAFDREAKSQFSYNVSLSANSENLTFSRRGAWGNEKQRLIRPNADLNYSRRLTDRIGINLSYRLSEITHDYPRATRSWNYTANGASPTNPYMTTFNMYNEQKITHRESLSTKLDFRASSRTRLSFTGQWNWYDLTFNGRSVGFTTGTPEPGFTPDSVVGRPGTSNVTMNVGQRNKYGPTYVLGTRFTHDFGRGKLSGAYNWSQAENKYRDTTKGFVTNVNLNLLRPAGSNTVVAFDRILSGPVPAVTVTQNGSPVDYRDLSNFSVPANSWRTRPFTSQSLKQGVNLDYRLPFATVIPLTVQTGVRRNESGRKIRRLGVNVAHPALSGSALEALRDDYFSGEDLGFGFGGVEWLSGYEIYSTYPNLTSTYTENVMRDIDETTNGAYLRFDVTPLPNFTVVTGARYENKEMDATAQNFRTARERQSTARLEYDGWYPSLNVKYNPRRDLVFRAGLSRTIGHPEYSDIIPTVTDYDPESPTSTGTISVPNPDIQPYKVTNFDVTGEWYLGSSGVLSSSLFRKNVEGFISRASVGFLNTLPNADALSQEYGIPEADRERYRVTLSENGRGSTVDGFEFSYAQGLSFLPKPFNTLNLQLNFTRIWVKGDTFAERLAQLESATTRSANAVIGWRLGRFNILTAVNHTGDVVTNTGSSATSPSTFREAVTKTDVTVSYTVNSFATLFLQVRNITGEGRTDLQTPSDPALFMRYRVPNIYSEYGDPLINLGVRGRF